MSIEREKNLTNAEMLELWTRNKGLCVTIAKRNAWIADADPAVSIEDLTQTAFLGLVKAAETYDPAKRKTFAGWATWAITGEFRRLIGCGGGNARNPHHYAQSLDVPAFGDDSDETALDLIADASAEEAFEDVEAAQVAQAVNDALCAELDADTNAVMRAHFMQEQSYAQIARNMGVPAQYVRRCIGRGLISLRKSKRIRRAVSLWDNLPSYSTGFSAFKANGSQPERAALWLIEHEGGEKDG